MGWLVAILFIFVALLVISLPVRWAAQFCGGTNTGLGISMLASVLAPVLAVLMFRALNGGLGGFLLAYCTLLGSYMTILRVPFSAIVGFAVIVFALQVAVFLAFISMGLHLPGHLRWLLT